jgi:hypothetical protein
MSWFHLQYKILSTSLATTGILALIYPQTEPQYSSANAAVNPIAQRPKQFFSQIKLEFTP